MSKIGIIILAIFFLYVVFLFGVAINDDSEEVYMSNGRYGGRCDNGLA